MGLKQPRSEVSESELAVLKVFWNRTALKVGEVRDILNGLGKSWAYNTVQTLIKRLEQKGYLRSEKDGRAFVFSATMSRQEYLSSSLSQLAKRVCAGSRTPMFHALVENQAFSKEEICEFRALLDQLESDFEDEDSHPEDVIELKRGGDA